MKTETKKEEQVIMKRILCADCVALLPKETEIKSLSIGAMPIVFRGKCDECGNTTSVASILIDKKGHEA